MLRKMLLIALTLAVCAVYGGCSEEENNPVAPAPTMTGRWDVVFESSGAQDGIHFDLTGNNGVVSGTITTPEGDFPLNGTCSSSGQVHLSYDVLQEDTQLITRNMFDGQMNRFWTALNGTFQVVLLPSGKQILSSSFTAVRRWLNVRLY